MLLTKWKRYGALGLFVFLAACAWGGNTKMDTVELVRFSENGASVVVYFDGDIFATYTPLEANYHFYAKDLPRDGVDGVGRPTLLEIYSDSVSFIGETQESVAAFGEEEGFSAPLLRYPDGPVTLRIPIRFSSIQTDDVPVELSVTYMLCSSEGGCKPPVIDQRFIVRIPASLIQVNH